MRRVEKTASGFTNAFYEIDGSTYLWNNSTDEAVLRMRDVLHGRLRLDTRDYGALACVLSEFIELRKNDQKPLVMKSDADEEVDHDDIASDLDILFEAFEGNCPF